MAFLLASAVAACAGCGLQDYEKKMGEQQVRLKYESEENSYLHPLPIQILGKKPDGKELDFNSENLFFRPPEGIENRPDEKFVGSFNRFPATEGLGFKEMLVAIVRSEDREKFKSEILKELHLSGPPKVTTATRLGVTRSFELYELDGPKESTRLFWDQGDPNFQVAIAFRVPGTASNWSSVEQKIVYSLASLMTGIPATTQHRTYKPAPRVSTPKTGKR
jgi:hypothetical protein